MAQSPRDAQKQFEVVRAEMAADAKKAAKAGKGAAKKPPGVEKVRTMILMPADLYGKIQTLVAKQKSGGERGASLSSVVTEALEEFFKGK